MTTTAMLHHPYWRYVGITIGCLIASCSINLFLVPSHLLTGGATGIAIIFYYLCGWPIGLQTFLYNIPLLLASWRLMGHRYTVDIVIGTGIFSACLDVTRFLNAYAPVNDYMLAAIFGGVFNGIGYGLVFRMNGSTGGFDILGAIMKKYYSLGMGGVIFAFNCVLMCISAFLFGVAPAMFTLICMYMNGSVTDGSRPRRDVPARAGRVYAHGKEHRARSRESHADRENQAHHACHRSGRIYDHHLG